MRKLTEVIQERLDTLGINPFEAARRAGLEKGFVNDLLIGKKNGIRQAGLEKLAAALECDPEYLTGHIPTPRRSSEWRSSTSDGGSVPFGGIVENGTWREASARRRSAVSVPTAPDPRFPASAQTAFIIRGDAADGVGIRDGAVVIGCALATFESVEHRLRDGDIVIVRRWRSDRSEQELSIRRVSGGQFAPVAGGGQTVSREEDGLEIQAVVVQAIQIF